MAFVKQYELRNLAIAQFLYHTALLNVHTGERQ